jgi:hypothetical protein
MIPNSAARFVVVILLFSLYYYVRFILYHY